MTEDEAKTKCCCEQLNSTHIFPRCLGSACMAWRWVQMEGNRNIGGQLVVETSNSEHGYCGKADKP